MDPIIGDTLIVLATIVGGVGVTILAMAIAGAPGKRVAGRGRKRRR